MTQRLTAMNCDKSHELCFAHELFASEHELANAMKSIARGVYKQLLPHDVGSRLAVRTALPTEAPRLVLFLDGFVFVVEFIVRTRLVFACEVIKIFIFIKVNYAHIVANILIKIEMLTALAKISHKTPSKDLVDCKADQNIYYSMV